MKPEHKQASSWMKVLLLSCVCAFAALPAFGQLDRFVAEAMEGDIDCLPCAVTIEMSLKNVEGVDRISVSMSRQMVAATFKDGARFTPDKYREAIAKAEVRVKAFSVVMRGTAAQDGGKTYFVAGDNRFLVENPPSNLPLGKLVKVTAAVDDSAQPYKIVSITEVSSL
jgi:copper chaperone CopZ